MANPSQLVLASLDENRRVNFEPKIISTSIGSTSRTDLGRLIVEDAYEGGNYLATYTRNHWHLLTLTGEWLSEIDN